MARTTISDLVEAITRELNSTHRYEISTLGAALNATETVVTLTYALPPSLREGAELVVETETMRVMDIDANAKTATVIRGYEGSTAAAHLSGLEVQINPRFTAKHIYDAMVDECHGLPETLFRVDQHQAAVSLGADTIELPATWTNLYGIIDARHYLIDPINQVGVDRTTWPRLPGRVVRGVLATWTEGPSTGIYYRLKKRIATQVDLSSTAGHAYFTAALPFDLTTVDLTDDIVTDFGMQASMLDIIKMGVKLRLLPDEEIGRSDRRAQDENRRADEVRSGAAIRPVPTLMTLYLRRRQEEANRLRALYPTRIA